MRPKSRRTRSSWRITASWRQAYPDPVERTMNGAIYAEGQLKMPATLRYCEGTGRREIRLIMVRIRCISSTKSPNSRSTSSPRHSDRYRTEMRTNCRPSLWDRVSMSSRNSGKLALISCRPLADSPSSKTSIARLRGVASVVPPSKRLEPVPRSGDP